MKQFSNQIEKIFCAVTFAEAGEHETALSFLGTKTPESRVQTNELTWFERMWAAVTFAEHDCPETARSFLTQKPRIRTRTNRLNQFIDSVGLKNARYNYGYLVIQ